MNQTNNASHWVLPGTVKDRQSVTRDWQAADQSLIDGVAVVEVKNVVTSRGHLTEIYRADWNLTPGNVAQVFQTILEPGATSAWHAHAKTTDRLFAAYGRILIVLYDARRDSPTFGRLNQFRFGSVRPALVSIPVGIWHGVQNVASSPSLLLNLVSECYSYEDPDHYRLPIDTREIPFQFQSRPADALAQASETK